jgi:hypothetical protein
MKSKAAIFVMFTTLLVLRMAIMPMNSYADPLFAPAINYPAGVLPNAICTGDFNADGFNDIVVSTYDGFTVLFNNGHAGFTSTDDYYIGPAPGSIVVDDFTGDGNPDLAVCLNTLDSVAIYGGDNLGYFTYEGRYYAGHEPGQMATADFNLNGYDDIALTNRSVDSISILWNIGYGHFTYRTSKYAPSYPDVICAANLDNGNLKDIAVGCYNSQNCKVFWNQGNMSFSNPTQISLDYRPVYIYPVDYDNNGHRDLVLVAEGFGLTFLQNNWDQTFENHSSLRFSDWESPEAFVAWNYNLDYYLDIALIDFRSSSPSRVYILTGNGPGFVFEGYEEVGYGAYGIAQADFDNDGDMDLAVTNNGSSTVSILINNHFGPSCNYVIGDINGNGSVNGVDIVYAVNYLKGGLHPPIDCFPNCPLTPNPFYAAADVNGNCAFNGIDVTFFVRYLKGQVPSLLYCIDCPPAN